MPKEWMAAEIALARAEFHEAISQYLSAALAWSVALVLALAAIIYSPMLASWHLPLTSAKCGRRSLWLRSFSPPQGLLSSTAAPVHQGKPIAKPPRPQLERQGCCRRRA